MTSKDDLYEFLWSISLSSFFLGTGILLGTSIPNAGVYPDWLAFLFGASYFVSLSSVFLALLLDNFVEMAKK